MRIQGFCWCLRLNTICIISPSQNMTWNRNLQNAYFIICKVICNKLSTVKRRQVHRQHISYILNVQALDVFILVEHPKLWWFSWLLLWQLHPADCYLLPFCHDTSRLNCTVVPKRVEKFRTTLKTQLPLHLYLVLHGRSYRPNWAAAILRQPT